MKTFTRVRLKPRLFSEARFGARFATRPARDSRRAYPRPGPGPPRRISRRPEGSPARAVGATSSSSELADALRNAKAEDNNLLSAVHIPEDPNGVLNEGHPAATILANSAIVVQRQLEMMNVMMGFEEANRYIIMDGQGNHIGYMAEQEFGMGNMLARQTFRTHRSFTTHVFDKHQKEVLRFHRPFSYVSSRIRVYDPLEVAATAHSSATGLQTTAPGSLSTNVNQSSTQVSPLALSDMRIIGEAQQQWALLRRKYNLFLHNKSSQNEGNSNPPRLASGDLPVSDSKHLQVSRSPSDDTGGQYNQFAYVDEPFLSWDFSLLSSDFRLIGSVNRNWSGFGREIFTDTGVYALRMDAAGLAEEPRHLISKTGKAKSSAYAASAAGMTLDQRAIMLATAVNVDFDYFSRQRSGAMGFMPMWFPIGGAGMAGAADGEAAGEAATEAAGEARSGATSGVGEGGEGEEIWGSNPDPWGEQKGGSSSGDGGGEGDGDGGLFDEFF